MSVGLLAITGKLYITESFLLPQYICSAHVELCFLPLLLKKVKTIFLISSNGVQKVFPLWTLLGKLFSSHMNVVQCSTKLDTWFFPACISSCGVRADRAVLGNSGGNAMFCFLDNLFLPGYSCFPEKTSDCGYLHFSWKEEQFGTSTEILGDGGQGASECTRETLRGWWG